MPGHVILFKHVKFHGPHKHVFDEEKNLNASDDNSFNDTVSSFVVLSGVWKFYRNSNFNGAYDREFGPGLYPNVSAVDIQNDDMSSLKKIRDR